MNFDGRVDANDVAGFVLGLIDADAYERTFGVSNVFAGDLDFDGDVDYDDIHGLVTELETVTSDAVAEDAANRRMS